MMELSIDRSTAIRPRPVNRLTNCSANILSRQPRAGLLSDRHFDDQDGPGKLSRAGPRHDNDHEDYRSIRILPTADEVLSTTRPQFMPKKNIGEPHFLSPGPSRLLDIHFRHLRYDSTESIRDVLYTAAQTSFFNNHNSAEHCHKPFLETAIGNRYHMYSGVRIEELVPHERKGVVTKFSFDCPPHLKGQAIHRSSRLEAGMLCALMLLNNANNELSIVYFDVDLRQSAMSLRSKGNDKSRAAVQLAFHDGTSHDDILQITRLAHGLERDTEVVLVEFPNVLYLSFYNPLHRLQQMKPDDVAFNIYLAPEVQHNVLAAKNHVAVPADTFVVPPPVYTSEPDFHYDLTPIASKETKLPMTSLQIDSSQSTLALIADNTTLDGGQAVALCNSLSRELVFTQGPPGTGKTFLGVALAQVLLASRNAGRDKPIIVVCLTNHALDSFMSGLRDAGVADLLRIGGGSKEEWTSAINLTQKSRGQRYKADEHRDFKGLASQKDYASKEMSVWCDAITAKLQTQRPSWLQLKPVLPEQVCSQLVTASDDISIQGFAFDYWAGGGDLNHIHKLQEELAQRLITTSQHQTTRQRTDVHQTGCQDKDCPQNLVQETLRTIAAHAAEQSARAGVDDLWQLPYESRQCLVVEWSLLVDEETSATNLAYLHKQYRDLLTAERHLRDKKDLRTIAKQDVIGLTTTGCAGRREVLRALAPEILICEEAGEVMEAHALCALLPSVKHAIFIGDPLQLRPQIQEQAMTLETSTGMHYRLDESLFERFMFPRDPNASIMPTSQLNIQRRMHPQIADFSRLTYPFLEDHPSTLAHPVAKGLAERTFWLDHRVAEGTDSSISDSVFNLHEIEMVRAMIHYLLRGSEYSAGDIAVLTPYAAQLKKLVESLQATCTIWLSEEDKNNLLDNGQLDMDLESVQTKMEVKMDDMLRCATIDNFQGEEAKIIILSTVRSGGRPGFLKTTNRINVACSRARDGFFIIGNAQTLSQVPMWKKVIDVFDRGLRRGPSLRLECPRHPDHNTRAENPSDFEDFTDCSHMCGAILECGHECPEACHNSDLHERIPCTQPCEEILACGHQCTKTCAVSCGDCIKDPVKHELECGHSSYRLCSGKILDCALIVETKTLACGIHTVDILCGQQEGQYKCDSRCAAPLPCGHLCSATCEQCISAGTHKACAKKCGILLDCGHICSASCHAGAECPPCRQPCNKRCSHGKCKNMCGQPCYPCMKRTVIDLSSSDRCDMICSLDTVDIGNYEDTIDRILQRLAVMMNTFIKLLNDEKKRLNHGFVAWTKLIRPNPLAADANMAHVMSRDDALVKIQERVVNFRGKQGRPNLLLLMLTLSDNVIDPVDYSIATLHQRDPNKMRNYMSLFYVRFDILEYRVVGVRLDDKLRVIEYLLHIHDTSGELHRQATNILQFVLTECIMYVGFCESTLQDVCLTSNPCLESETRLHQIRFRLLADYSRRQLNQTNIKFPNPILPVGEDVLLHSLDRVEEVSKHYSATNKVFLDICTKYRHVLTSEMDHDKAGLALSQIPSVYSDGGRHVEREWSKHQLNHLTTCKYDHPFSQATFPDGCPECGLWNESEEVVQDRARKLEESRNKAAKDHLHEDAFLAVIETMTIKVPMRAKRELTPEEKFFEAMDQKYGRS